jgi:hypothetical protein
MLAFKSNPNKSTNLIENHLIQIDEFTYEIPSEYNHISGHLDLSSYDNLTIIIPETIHNFSFMCITCVANTPSINNHKQHCLIFKHLSFHDVNFDLCCFDGINNFKFMNQNVISEFPKSVSSYKYSMQLISNNGNLNDELMRYLENERMNINQMITTLQLSVQHNDNNMNTKLLKLKIKNYEQARLKLNEVLNLLN